MKAHGGTVVCSYGYSISPSSSRSALGTVDSFVHAGGKEGVLDTSLPFGSVAMTTPALVAKQKGCNAYYAGPRRQLERRPGDRAAAGGRQAQGDGLPDGVRAQRHRHPPPGRPCRAATSRRSSGPSRCRTPARSRCSRRSRSTRTSPSSEFPSFSQYESWLGADLMIKGLQMAGPTASHAAVISALRSIKNYNGNGLLPESIDYSTDFGHDLREVVRVVHEGREERLRGGLEPALVRHGPAGHHHRVGVDRLRPGISPRWRWRSWDTSARRPRPSRAALGRVLVQHVEQVVVPDLEDLGGQAHAERVALAQVEINHDTHRRYLQALDRSAGHTRG